MSFINRFSKKIYGGIVFTGNSLGVSKKENELLAGTHHSIGAFITTNEGSSYKDFGPGTTNEYTLSRSNAHMILPDDVEVQYAELIWSGRSEFIYEDKEYTIKEHINDDILFWTPTSKKEFKVTPCIETRIEDGFELGNKNNFYTRSADVTELVKTAGNGEYGVGSVPSLLYGVDAFSFVGWTLAVVYECKQKYEFRQINLLVGGKLVEYKQEDYELVFKDLYIPKEYQSIAKLYLSAGMGGFRTLGSEVFLKTSNNLYADKPLDGPNNLSHHFFASQINDGSGKLDKQGTRGEKNHILNKDKTGYISTIGARQGWDITVIDVSTHVEPYSKEATAVFKTEGSSYYLNAVACDVDAINTNVLIKKDVVSHSVNNTDEVCITLTLANQGSHVIKNAYITDYYPKEMKLIEDGICIANQKTGFYDKENKINFMIGEVTPLNLGGLEVSVGYKLKANSLSNFVDYKSRASVSYYIEEVEKNYTKDSNIITIINENAGFDIEIEQIAGEYDSNSETDTIRIREWIKNKSKKRISNVVIMHNLSKNACYENNLLINGIKARNDIESGIIIEEILPGDRYSLEYSIQVLTNEIDTIKNQVNVTGIYKDLEEEFVSQFKATKSKSIQLTIPKLEIDKISDRVLIGKPGDRINVTLTISNTGNVIIQNIIVTDKIQEGMAYVKGSTRINQGEAFHCTPERGIQIGDLEKESSCVVTYQAMLSK